MSFRGFHLALRLCVIGLLPALCHAEAASVGVGFMRLVAQGDLPVPVAVWYPSRVGTVPWDAGPYVIHATRDAPIAPGRHGLILLSHGSGGGEFGQADLAESLAKRGYVVAAPASSG